MVHYVKSRAAQAETRSLKEERFQRDGTISEDILQGNFAPQLGHDPVDSVVVHGEVVGIDSCPAPFLQISSDSVLLGGECTLLMEHPMLWFDGSEDDFMMTELRRVELTALHDTKKARARRSRSHFRLAERDAIKVGEGFNSSCT